MLSPGLWLEYFSEVTLLQQVNFNIFQATCGQDSIDHYQYEYIIICIHCNQLYNTTCQNTNISISNHTMVAVVLYVMRVLVFNYGVIDPNPKQCEDPD